MGSTMFDLSITLSCFILILSWSSVYGKCIPENASNPLEIEPHQVHEEIEECAAYRDSACCDAEGTEFLKHYIFPAYDGVFDTCESCAEGWKHVMCSVMCSPDQDEFVSGDFHRTDKETVLYICSDVCEKLHHACGEESLPPPSRTIVRYRYPTPEEFCKSNIVRLDTETSGLLRVEIIDKDKNKTHGCLGLEQIKIVGEGEEKIVPYCVQHHSAHHLAGALATAMIPFTIGALVANYFHKHHIHFIPESGIMIIAGVFYGLGIVVSLGQEGFSDLVFNQTLFVIVLLPPIIFESGYALRQKKFMENMGAILFYAIVGTALATVVIGLGLYYAQDLFPGALSDGTFWEWITFAALISAVDPVATLATFNSVGVEEDLGMIIFGEALINDAVAIVLFNTAKVFVEDPVNANFGDAVVNFLMIGLGSPLLGIALGMLASKTFKYVDFGYEHFFLETIVFLMITYSSFLLAEGSGLSGIIASLVCGCFCEHYTYLNLSKGGREMTLLCLKELSTLADMTVFFMTGMMLVVTFKNLTIYLLLITFVLILVARMFSVLPLTCILNIFRGNKISWQYMAMIWFSGLRGAIAVTLALDVPSGMREQLTAATVWVAVLTVFVFGGTTSSALHKLGITVGIEKRQKVMMAHSLEEIKNFKGWKYIDNRYLKPCLVRRKNLMFPEHEDGPADQLYNIQVQLQQTEINDSKFEPAVGDTTGFGSILESLPAVGSIFKGKFEEDEQSHYQLMAPGTGTGDPRQASKTREQRNAPAQQISNMPNESKES